MLNFAVILLALPAWGHDSGQTFCLRLLESQSEFVTAPADGHRKMALVRELIRLQAPRERSLIPADASEDLQRLSRENLARMTTELETLWPIKGRAPVTTRKIEALVDQVEFWPMIRMAGGLTSEITPGYDFYTELTGAEDTVGFKWVATRQGAPVTNFSSHVAADSAVLGRDFQNKYAFVIPLFSSARELMTLFAEWDPPALDALAAANRWNVPYSAWKSTEDFLDYVYHDPAAVFSPGTAHVRMAPLRQRLYRFVLLARDAGTFYRDLLRHYLTVQALNRSLKLSELTDQWEAAGQTQRLFQVALKEAGFEGVEARVPISVPASQFHVLSERETLVRALPDFSRMTPPHQQHHDKMDR